MKHKYPAFHPDEEAHIGSYAFDPRVRNRRCLIRQALKAVAGEHRYVVKADNGVYATVLESTLTKRFERSDWGMLRGIWQPKREAR